MVAQRIPPRAWLLAVPVLFMLQAAILWAAGHSAICTCGTVKLWHGVAHSPETSQHVFDWYSFTHVVHGFLLYFFLWLVSRRASLALRFALGVLIEGVWEILENTPFIIERYRDSAIEFAYYGDSIVNSLADTFTMMAGFLLAAWLPVWATLALALAMEATLGYLIRDNLILNVIMLTYPSAAIKAWQAAAPLR